MKTNQHDQWRVMPRGGKQRAVSNGNLFPQPRIFGRDCLDTRCPRAFTLVELLAVIAIIAVLAGLTIPALDAIKRNQVISQTRAEMNQLSAAIDSYHSAFGFYPPGNPGSVRSDAPSGSCCLRTQPASSIRDRPGRVV